ncbi:MAG: sugar transferase, partial [Verrucomicrobia bacterium]|nr:sugar transferase [Verrucomicrobiota bacterium]
QWSKKLSSQVISAVGLLVFAPLFLAIALGIKVSSKGQVFYLQERIGKGGKPFRMIKFRTMVSNADQDLSEMLALNESYGGLFKIRCDPRVTKLGRFLRRYSLDELPQLINVVRGEMTLVGPRPLPRSDHEHFSEKWHSGRQDGMPGLTCLWQISGRSDLDFHSMCILDVFYLRNQNWVMDLKIVLRTFSVVLFAEGAY